MNKLDKLFVREQKVTIGEGEEATEVTIYPLSLDDFGLMSDLSKLSDQSFPSEKKKSLVIAFVAKVLRVPEDEVAKIQFNHLEAIMNAATKVVKA
jgi:hypothetical protein